MRLLFHKNHVTNQIGVLMKARIFLSRNQAEIRASELEVTGNQIRGLVLASGLKFVMTNSFVANNDFKPLFRLKNVTLKSTRLENLTIHNNTFTSIIHSLDTNLIVQNIDIRNNTNVRKKSDNLNEITRSELTVNSLTNFNIVLLINNVAIVPSSNRGGFVKIC